MKKMFGIALLMLPLLAVSARATGAPYSVQGQISISIKGGPAHSPQAGPWYLYWPLEAHFVAPAPTGYPYWPGPQVLPPTSIGGPAYPPPPAPLPPPVPAPAVVLPAPALNAPAPATGPQLSLPPYLQPTSYSPVSYPSQGPSHYFVPSTGQAPSYWYDR